MATPATNDNLPYTRWLYQHTSSTSAATYTNTTKEIQTSKQ